MAHTVIPSTLYVLFLTPPLPSLNSLHFLLLELWFPEPDFRWHFWDIEVAIPGEDIHFTPAPAYTSFHVRKRELCIPVHIHVHVHVLVLVHRILAINDTHTRTRTRETDKVSFNARARKGKKGGNWMRVIYLQLLSWSLPKKISANPPVYSTFHRCNVVICNQLWRTRREALELECLPFHRE